ncbi:hypothetical protein [Sphingomonas sp. MMS24-J13]|uniref:hypothetical protein n=1 Tax=Sphingomonas sp. MMS24-J13 TaxID=3238686 RepID=UPI00384C5CAF
MKPVSLPVTNGSGLTVSMRVNFKTGSETWSVTGSSTTALLDNGKTFVDSPNLKAAVAAQVSSSLSAEAMLSAGGMAPQVRDPFLRAFVQDIRVYHTKDHTNRFIISEVDLFGGAGNLSPYVRIYVKNLTTNIVVCSKQLSLPTPAASADVAVATFITWLQANYQTLVLTDELYSFSNVLAYLTPDWSQLATIPYGTKLYTTFAAGGIHPSRIYDDGNGGSDYLDLDRYGTRINVPADGATFDATIVALQDTVGGATSANISSKAHYANPVRLFLSEGGHTDANRFVPAFVELQGSGRTRTEIRRSGNALAAVIQTHVETKVRDLKIISDMDPQYPDHNDPVNGMCFDPSGYQTRFFRQKWERVDFVMAGTNAGQGFGCGIPSGALIEFNACRAYHERTDLPGSTYVATGWFFHNTGPTINAPTIRPSTMPSRVKMVACGSSDDTFEAIYISTLERVALCTLELVDCDNFAMLQHEVLSGGEVITDLAVDRVGWDVVGNYAGPFRYKDLDGAWVLAAPVGTVITGALAATIFGTVDSLGRGAKWIKNGSTKSLGARLGDMTGNSASLTLNGQSWTPTTDLTSASNTSITDAIFAATGVQLTQVDLRLETFPHASPRRRMRNSTATTIPKGRFVTRVSRGHVELAQVGVIAGGKVTAGGTGYTSVPTATIVGDGTGATATVTIAGGVVTGITTTRGKGYTNATVVISGGGGTGATATVVIGNDPILGWTIRDILAGGDDEVITTKRIWWEYIAGATADGGAWGISADGQLSFGAPIKLGYAIGGTLTIA